MKVNVTVNDLVTFYDATRFDIKVGTSFTAILEDYPKFNEWVASHDQVLDIVEGANQIEAVAKTVGRSRIFIMNEEDEFIKILEVNVLASIEPMATTLGLDVQIVN